MPPIIKAADQFAETRIDDEVVLMHIDSGNFHALKATGLAIWDLIDDQRDEAAISAELQGRFAVTPDECDREVTRFVGELRAAGFLA